MNKNKRSGIVARTAMLLTLAYTVALLCAATPINGLKLQGDANAAGNSITNAATISATNGYFNNLVATNGFTGNAATASYATNAGFSTNAGTSINVPVGGITGLGSGVPNALENVMNGTGSMVGSSNAMLTTPTLTLPEASIYPIRYLVSLLIESDETGPQTFTSTDGSILEPFKLPGGQDIYTAAAFRDPCLIKAENIYYLSYTATTGSAVNHIGLAYSTDLRSWTTLSAPNWSSYFTGSQNEIWNGCWFYDGTNYWMYFATAGSAAVTPWIVQFTPNGASSSFETPSQVVFSRTAPSQNVVAVAQSGSTFYGLCQETTSNGQYVDTFSTPALTGTNYAITTTNSDGFGTAVEAGCLAPNPSGGWNAYFTTFAGGYLYTSSNSTLSTTGWSSPVTIGNFTPYSTNYMADWINVVPYNDLQTDQCINAIAANAGPTSGANTVGSVISGSNSTYWGQIFEPSLANGNHTSLYWGKGFSAYYGAFSLGGVVNTADAAEAYSYLNIYGTLGSFYYFGTGNAAVGNYSADPHSSSPAGSFTAEGNVYGTVFNSSAAQSTSNGSTAGTMVSSEPFEGTSYKKVIVMLSGFDGTGSYTFPAAFTSTNDLVLGGTLSADATTTTTAISISTSTNSTGSITVEGF